MNWWKYMPLKKLKIFYKYLQKKKVLVFQNSNFLEALKNYICIEPTESWLILWETALPFDLLLPLSWLNYKLLNTCQQYFKWTSRWKNYKANLQILKSQLWNCVVINIKKKNEISILNYYHVINWNASCKINEQAAKDNELFGVYFSAGWLLFCNDIQKLKRK